LKFVARVLAQKLSLLPRLHALGHHRQAQSFAHRDNGLRQIAVVAANGEVANE